MDAIFDVYVAGIVFDVDAIEVLVVVDVVVSGDGEVS